MTDRLTRMLAFFFQSFLSFCFLSCLFISPHTLFSSPFILSSFFISSLLFFSCVFFLPCILTCFPDSFPLLLKMSPLHTSLLSSLLPHAVHLNPLPFMTFWLALLFQIGLSLLFPITFSLPSFHLHSCIWIDKGEVREHSTFTLFTVLGAERKKESITGMMSVFSDWTSSTAHSPQSVFT